MVVAWLGLELTNWCGKVSITTKKEVFGAAHACSRDGNVNRSWHQSNVALPVDEGAFQKGATSENIFDIFSGDQWWYDGIWKDVPSGPPPLKRLLCKQTYFLLTTIFFYEIRASFNSPNGRTRCDVFIVFEETWSLVFVRCVKNVEKR